MLPMPPMRRALLQRAKAQPLARHATKRALGMNSGRTTGSTFVEAFLVKRAILQRRPAGKAIPSLVPLS